MCESTTSPTEPLESHLLADVAACGSTLLPGWSSVATTSSAATASTITISPHRPPVLFFISADIAAFFPRRPFPDSFQRQKKQCRTISTILPPFKRSYLARNSVRSRLVVSLSFFCSSICRNTLYLSGSGCRKRKQITSSTVYEPFARMLRTFSIIAAKTGVGLAPGLTWLDVSAWRYCTFAPQVDALYVSSSARYPAAGEEAWCKI